MKIDYHNMPKGAGMTTFAIRYIMNIVRTWYLFHLKYPWVKYNGFVRVMAHTTFARGMKISIGHNVQFGEYCNIASDVVFKNNILILNKLFIYYLFIVLSEEMIISLILWVNLSGIVQEGTMA